MKKLIIFDLYGTLIVDDGIELRRGYRTNAIYSLLESLNLPIRFTQVRDAYDHARQRLMTAQKQGLSSSLFDVVQGFCAELSINDRVTLKKIYDIWAFAALQISPKLLPEVAEGLALLKDHGRLLAMISNTSSTPGVALRFLLAEMNVYSFFDDLVFSDEFGLMKPRPLIFTRSLQRFGLKPEEALFIGDHEVYDKGGAEQSGIDYLLMNPSISFMQVARKALDIS